MRKKKGTVQDRYNEFLEKLLDEQLYLVASDVIKHLIDKFNVLPENARKIIGRAVKQECIKSSAPYTFGKKQFAYLSVEHSLTKNDIKKISKENRPPIYRLLELMDQNGGIVSYYEALKITASPVEKSSTKVDSLEDILTFLMKLDIVQKTTDNNGVGFVIYKDAADTGLPEELLRDTLEIMTRQHYDKMIADCILLPDILNWLRRSNIIDSEKVIYRNKTTPHRGGIHNNLVWDAFGYSSTTGIKTVAKKGENLIDKKTLVVLDVVLSHEYLDIHLDAFISRMQINVNSVKEEQRKVLPIIVYASSSIETINKMRKYGIITFDIGYVFGNRIYEVLNDIGQLPILESVNSGDVDKVIEKMLDSISSSGQDDALKALKGTLFEYLMYPLLKTIFPNAIIERNKTLIEKTKEGKRYNYEYDYIIQNNTPKELIFVELKGYRANAIIDVGDWETKNTLKWFFNRTLPFAMREHKAMKEEGIVSKAIYITSANFSDEGRLLIEEYNKSSFKSRLLDVGYDREPLLSLLREYEFESEIKIIDKFYKEVDSKK
ncbi:hypothetical protein HX045_03120 [Myroides odoratimimus]|uniref:hypothetical protein n=1 Tax=Myroides odoratimimus TaxID=76832 RepID=UPI0025767187|nr:hypothetical protein [Myroides odoratimimus]MDM1455826.1 hypothetical protein [Myroides odoratimimus]MDM1468079.1 hypothetical protein [Myroides odoratimimus]MDM1471384.1 hypothetical protein [Myroides odoratimimus]MDM1481510.1 hypothetical protein [Myroides odoratimimus]MDM1482675.1 hypothetical protein [Myroides odoratimimus]